LAEIIKNMSNAKYDLIKKRRLQ